MLSPFSRSFVVDAAALLLCVLQKAHVGVALCTVDGRQFSCGYVNDYFCLSDAASPFMYAIARDIHGKAEVDKYVGSGQNSNHGVLSLNNEGKPHNPIITTGMQWAFGLCYPIYFCLTPISQHSQVP